VGLILDSTVLIAAERKGRNARQALAEIAVQVAGEDVGVSVITLVELAHGVARANTAERRAARGQFLNELTIALPVYPVTVQSLCARAKSTVRTLPGACTWRFRIYRLVSRR